MDSDDDFERRLAELEARGKAGTGSQGGANPSQPAFEADLVPDPGPVSTYQPTEEDLEIDTIVEGVGILDAYRRWCGKSDPKPGKRTEGIKVSCPSPDHLDRDPSAWLNTDKDVGTCGGCGVGFDPFDIAAWKFGFPVPGYKQGKNFPDLKRAMAEDLGYTVTKTLSGQTIVSAPAAEDESDDDAQPGPGAPPATPPSSVLPASSSAASGDAASGDEQDTPPTLSIVSPILEEETLEYPTVPWRMLLDRSSFLRTWMDVTSKDDLPEEFYFWLGMAAVGFAAGRDVVLADNPQVRANMYLCLYGPTGQGKSRAIGALTSVLHEALPYDHDDENSTGTYLVPSPGSAEALVDAFSRPIEDNGKIVGYGAVRGLVRFDELSTLMGRANRAGNPMKPTLMEFFDGYHDVEHKTRGMGHVKASGYFATTLTTTQPKAIRQLLVQADADSGFANRWVFAAGKSKERVSYGRSALELHRTIKPLQSLRAWSALTPGGRQLHLEGTALRIWDEFFHEVLTPAQEQDESNLLTRCDLLLKKCITLFCIDRMEATPSAETVEAALGLWPYLLESYGLVSPEVGIGEFEHIRTAVRNYVIGHEARHNKAPALRDITRGVARNKFPGDLLVKVIRTMVELDELEEIVTKPARGPSKTAYHYGA